MRLTVVMNRLLIGFSLLLSVLSASAEGIVKGKVLDKNTNNPLEFVNIQVFFASDTTLLAGGTITDINGFFQVSKLSDGPYIVKVSYVGYKEVNRHFTISSQNQVANYPVIYIHEDAKMLREVQVTGQRSAMRLEVDRKSYDVSQLVSTAGQTASDVLESIPAVEVDNDGNISLRGNSSVEVWINGKASGLTSDNRASILEQLPAESIERIEVIDNPSAKLSAEGSAGIINIVLKKNRTAGYYGSVQAGVDTRKGANTSFNINYTSSKWDAYANIGFRHRNDEGYTDSEQEYPGSGLYQNYHGTTRNQGNNLFTRAGLTWHITWKDDIGISGMFMKGLHKNWGDTPYRYGRLNTGEETRMMLRRATGRGDMDMPHGEFNYRHNFTDKHFLDMTASYNRWKADNDNWYQDSTVYYGAAPQPTEYGYQYRPMFVNSRGWEFKIDYENPLTDKFKIQAGYQGNLNHENTPQESWIDNSSWTGTNVVEDQAYYNRFIYDMDIHALYFTAQYQLGKLGIMGGLRGEYWKVNTESYDWEQEHDAAKRGEPFKKDYFELFPSIFMSYQLTPNDQFQLNYARRLRRPWGGQLNSFLDTRDATTVSFGNPELTPEFSNSFSLNYLRTWNKSSLLVSAYYRPTTDVMQRINWRGSSDGLMYSTSVNVARSTSSGLEATMKNNLFRRLELTTNMNAYYYKLNGFSYDIDGQTITGEGRHSFTWDARMTASLILPYDISVQMSGRYNSRQAVSQGYRKARYNVDLGLRKNFLNKKLTLSVSCRDLFNSRKWESYTSSDTFWRHQINKRGSRKVNFTLTWNFGNNNKKKHREQQGGEDELDPQERYNGGGEM